MKFTLTADQISTMIADGVAKALASQGASPQAASPHFLLKGSKAAPSDLASKDAAIVAAFKRKGFTDVVLMDRSDKSKPFNVRPFKGWLDQGRIVRKGSKGCKGLFHVLQTDPIPGKASPSPKKGKPQLVKA
jgi:hypothetical protein